MLGWIFHTFAQWNASLQNEDSFLTHSKGFVFSRIAALLVLSRKDYEKIALNKKFDLNRLSLIFNPMKIKILETLILFQKFTFVFLRVPSDFIDRTTSTDISSLAYRSSCKIRSQTRLAKERRRVTIKSADKLICPVNSRWWHARHDRFPWQEYKQDGRVLRLTGSEKWKHCLSVKAQCSCVASSRFLQRTHHVVFREGKQDFSEWGVIISSSRLRISAHLVIYCCPTFCCISGLKITR